MRILLTGTTGQVGGALRRRLAALGTVMATDRQDLDLRYPETIMGQLDHLRPDLIVNPAAYTAVDLAEDESELAFRVNAEAPAAMARWATAQGVPLVHFSTEYVFDGSGTTPWQEDAAKAPLSVYGASKLAGELAIRDAGGHYLIVRTSWVYAAHGHNFLRTIARLAHEKTELRIVSDQIGAPTSAPLIAEAIATILQREFSEGMSMARSSVINLTASGVASWYDFAIAIVTGMRQRGAALAVENIVPVASSDYPTRAIRPLNSRLDPSRLKQLYDIQPPPWQEALDAELDTRFWMTAHDIHRAPHSAAAN